jgi:hypothetical protein
MSYTDFYEVAPWHDTCTDKDQSGGFMICRTECGNSTHQFVLTVSLDRHPLDN